MTQLGEVWRQAWTEVVAHQPVVARFSVPAGTLDGQARYLPRTVLQKVAFATIFRLSLPEKDSNWLREYPVNRADPLDSDQSDRLRAAVAEAEPWIGRLCALVLRTEKLVTQKELGTSDKRPGVMSLCLPMSSEAREVEDVALDELVAPFKTFVVPSGPSLATALEDPALVHRVATALASAASLDANNAISSDDVSYSERLLREFLDTPGLAALAAAEERATGAADPTVDRSWKAAKASGVDAWHSRVRAMRLSAYEVPPVPEVRSHQPLPVLEATLWLDTSLQGRLAPALKFPVARRKELPPLEDFIDAEIVRATSPLGLAEVASRTLVALAGIIQDEYIDLVELTRFEQQLLAVGSVMEPVVRTAATTQLMFNIQAWRLEKQAFEGNATFPNQALAEIIGFRGWYMTQFWRRVHTHEVQGGSISSPGEVWRLLTQVGITTVNNIRGKPWLPNSVGPQPFPEPSERPSSPEPESGDLTKKLLGEAMNDAIPRLARVRVGVEEMNTFLKRTDWGSPAHGEQWKRWCADADVLMSYEALERWWQLNQPD